MIAPISPKDVVKAKLESLPDAVIEAFNQAIASNWNGYYSIFGHDDVIPMIVGKFLGKYYNGEKVDRGLIFKLGWLDIESVYRKAGWKVEYDKPGYNESYSATWTFKR